MYFHLASKAGVFFWARAKDACFHCVVVDYGEPEMVTILGVLTLLNERNFLEQGTLTPSCHLYCLIFTY